jgi:glycosyltransferase involved in cell wall biosynthesis
MNVLHINWAGKFSGAEKFARDVAIRQKEATIAYMNRKLALGEEVEEKGIRVVEFNMRSGFDVINFIRYIFFIMREKFDIIHDHNGPPLTRLSKLFSSKSIFIQHIHGTKFGTQRWERFYVLLWNRFTSWLVDHYIANSNCIKKIVSNKEKISLARISVVYNGIELDNFTPTRPQKEIKKTLGIGEDEYVVGTIGRLTLQKGLDKFILIAKEVEDVKFVIVGEGELEEELKDLVKRNSLENRVIFTGLRKDIPDILSIFDIFLLTSNWEPFGIVLVEAMAIGVPVVAFNVDGVREVVEEGCGILISPNIKEAVKAIVFLKENPKIAHRLSAQALKLVRKKFHIKEKVKEIEKIYLTHKKPTQI